MSPSLRARHVLEPALRSAGIKTQTRTAERGRRYVRACAQRQRLSRSPAGLRLTRVRLEQDAYPEGAVFRLTPEAGAARGLLVYLHGGGYVRSIDRHHWRFAARPSRPCCAAWARSVGELCLGGHSSPKL